MSAADEHSSRKTEACGHAYSTEKELRCYVGHIEEQRRTEAFRIEHETDIDCMSAKCPEVYWIETTMPLARIWEAFQRMTAKKKETLNKFLEKCSQREKKRKYPVKTTFPALMAAERRNYLRLPTLF